MIRVAVLIPCRNEAIAISGVVAGFRAALPEAVVFVYDNNSTDGTGGRCKGCRGPSCGPSRCRARATWSRRMFADIEADAYILVGRG